MANCESIALILLAAGRGRRFGGGKLRADLGGVPLAHHSARRFAVLPFNRHIAVIGEDDLGLGPIGFELVQVARAGAPQSASIMTGIQSLGDATVQGVMIALADMPCVAAHHINELINRFDGDRICSGVAGAPMPPAIFGPRWFDALARLSGDKGARSLLSGCPMVEAPASTMLDIDTQEDLEKVQASLRQRALGSRD